jgi:hypothetical protein
MFLCRPIKTVTAGTRFGKDSVSRKYQDVMFSISAFNHGGFYSFWNAVVELFCYTSHRNERNLSKQAIAGCWAIVLPSTPSGGQLSVTGLNRFARPLNWLAPRSTIFLKNLVFAHPVDEIPAFCGTRRFIAVFTTTRHWTLSRWWWVVFSPSYPVYLVIYVLILSFCVSGFSK